MNETRWMGLVAIIIGAGICAWQFYEVSRGDSFTVWIVGCLPLPVIVLGGLFILGGLIALIKGKK